MRRISGFVLLFASLLLAGDPWTQKDLMQPADLAAKLTGSSASAKPVLLHVGFPVLFRASHIPGSVYAGPGSKDEGIAELKKAVQGVAKDREILIYCGCCPWEKCPNIRPAFAALHAMGYSKVKAMVVPENMKADWADKGYPFEKRAAE